MRETAKINAMRSGVVVIGALAFGYLTLQLGFKPFLEKSQDTVDQSQPSRKDQLNLNGFDNAQTTHESLSESISDS